MKKNLSIKSIFLLLITLLCYSCSTLEGITIIGSNSSKKPEIIQDSSEEKTQNISQENSQQYLQGSEDIPLMAEMKKLEGENESLGFDTNSGSIISSDYSIISSQDEVKKFYLETLPQMGWKLVNNVKNSIKFTREKQHLKIEFIAERSADKISNNSQNKSLEENPKEIIVRFFVSNQV